MARTLKNTASIVAMKAQAAALADKQEAIVTDLGEALDTLFAGADKVTTATKALDTAKAEHGVNSGNTRIAIFKRLAGIAHRNAWESSQIDAAIDTVKARFANRPKITVASFCNDIRRICDPDWREHVSKMFDDAEAAFKADKAVMEAAYKRPYHYVMNTLLPVRNRKNAEVLDRKLDMPATTREAIDRALKVPAKSAPTTAPLTIVADVIAALEALPDNTDIKSALASLRKLNANSFGKDSNAALDAQAKAQAKQRAEDAKPAAAMPEAISADILAQLTGQMTQMATALAALKTKVA